jgi:hypothetical protein
MLLSESLDPDIMEGGPEHRTAEYLSMNISFEHLVNAVESGLWRG